MENLDIIESQIRQMFAGTVWTHKIQEKQADICLKGYNKIEFWRVLASAVTSSGICTTIFVDEYWVKVISAIVSLVSLFINTYFKSCDFKLKHKQHKQSAIELLGLREEFISVLCDLRIGKYDENILIKKRDELLKKQQDIYARARDCDDKAVEKASKSLKTSKDNTYSDEEIDSFLPVLARKTKINNL